MAHNEEHLDVSSIQVEILFRYMDAVMRVSSENLPHAVFKIRAETTVVGEWQFFKLGYNPKTDKPQIHWHEEVPDDPVLGAVDTAMGMIFENPIFGEQMRKALLAVDAKEPPE
jgi:hypothetical protein